VQRLSRFLLDYAMQLECTQVDQESLRMGATSSTETQRAFQ
jgi:hypothetical protein